MNVAEFKAALDTVEQDHQLVLDKVHALKEGVGYLLAPEDLDAPRVLGRLQELDNYFVTQLIAHMDEEEVTLFPLLERHASEGAALAARLRREHEEIRHKLDAFTSCLGVALDLQDRPPRAVLWDLLVDGWELWEVLDRHAHAETDGLRQCLTRYFRNAGTPA
jgi:iron-sulfur cluster repair protein YtfE (RIC family)